MSYINILLLIPKHSHPPHVNPLQVDRVPDVHNILYLTEFPKVDTKLILQRHQLPNILSPYTSLRYVPLMSHTINPYIRDVQLVQITEFWLNLITHSRFLHISSLVT
jgi:hypothetical protein